ncbi:cupin domain-containing protein [Agarilytica rhodophyticola]|uniref:cupin domain-containing protein n=1 Tax=Agarilytica rhodophyticola TaxID=1737490 RepID=UPI00131A078F|nr:cupin domain-containing protein [Agarilytica rhodophyticola]
MMDLTNYSKHGITGNTIVTRGEIPGISEMQVEGEVRNLGIVKHFKNHSLLGSLIRQDFSIAWVHLDPDEVLEVHNHNVPSMIIAIEGGGSSQGDSEINFSAGDIVFIPSWNEHGFTGAKPSGLWALSIQFNDVAIFEDEVDPLTSYDLTNIPSIEERQLILFSRNKDRNLFKSEGVSRHIPSYVNFNWHSLDNKFSLERPPSETLRLILHGSPQGNYKFDKSLLTPGDLIVQTEDLDYHNTESTGNHWLLTIDISTLKQ